MSICEMEELAKDVYLSRIASFQVNHSFLRYAKYSEKVTLLLTL